MVSLHPLWDVWVEIIIPVMNMITLFRYIPYGMYGLKYLSISLHILDISVTSLMGCMG